jgi:poly(3-hydroxybutyrate) depolymerase
MYMRFSGILIGLLLGTPSILSATATTTTTALSSSLNPSIYGQAVTFTAVVTSKLGTPPNGEIVTFMQGSTVRGTGALNGGAAAFTISTLKTGGTDAIKAVYAGDSNFASSTSNTVSQVVNPAATTTTLVSSLNPSNVGQSVTFTARVAAEFSGTVTGNVAFYSGSTKLKGVPLSGGAASYTSTTLAAGTLPITAFFKGSSSFTTSNSSALSQTVGAGTFIDSTMTWDGITRYYEVFVPTVLPANPPMLLMLHGTKYTSDGGPDATGAWAVTGRTWGWQSYANQYGFVLVQPASTWDPSSHQWNWNAYFMDAAFPPPAPGTCTVPPATACPDDAGFLRNLMVNLTAQYNVNPNQVYVVGMSSGAQMAERVGVEISDLVAAIAPVSGQMEGQQTAPPPLLAPGNALAPISVQEWQGTLDNILWPCGYGKTNYSGVFFTLDTVDDTFNYWVGQNSCTTLQTTQTLCSGSTANPNVTGNLATGCTGNAEVQFIWEEGVGHAWNQKNIPAIWSFLSSHPK